MDSVLGITRYTGEDSRDVTNRKLPTCGQSYKHFAIVIYDFTVVVLTRNLYRERFQRWLKRGFFVALPTQVLLLQQCSTARSVSPNNCFSISYLLCQSVNLSSVIRLGMFLLITVELNPLPLKYCISWGYTYGQKIITVELFLNNCIFHFCDFHHTFINNTNLHNSLTNNSINNCFSASFILFSLKVERSCYAQAKKICHHQGSTPQPRT